MAISKIQSGDKVRIIAGNYKGSEGVVTKVVKTSKGKQISKRVAVSSVPKIVKYRKKFTYQGESYPGAKLSTDRLIDVSNVMLVDENNKVSKAKVVVDGNKKSRILKTTSKVVEKQSLKEVDETKEDKKNSK